jgi:plastocyanin
MYFSATLISLIAALSAVSAAPLTPSASLDARYDPSPITTHVISVGKDGLTYTPPYITATPGDILQFEFFSANHTLVQSSFADPCTPLVNGIFAGFQPSNVTKSSTGVVTLKTVEFELGTSAPLWFYCAQGKHCQAGMTFAVNPPEGSVAKFNQVAATKVNNIAPAGGPVGVLAGVVQRVL